MAEATKSINTLVSDIKSILVSQEIDKETVTDFGKRLADKLVSSLCKKSDQNTLRMSNLGTECSRKLWYVINKPELAEELPAEARLKFLYGDIIEEIMLFLAEAAGHTVTQQQQEVTLHGVTGHIDALVDGVLIDVKSTNARSFHKFRTHNLDNDDPFGYRTQLAGYLESLQESPGLEVKGQAGFLAVDKEQGNVCLDIYPKIDKDWNAEITSKRKMLENPEPPDRRYSPIPHGSSGNERLPIQCSYCAFRKSCWSDSNRGKGIRTFQYSSGPVELVTVIREPDVPEI